MERWSQKQWEEMQREGGVREGQVDKRWESWQACKAVIHWEAHINI